jgi:predicted dehydrogenase
VAWSSARLAELMKKSHAGVMVGYNRRHYASALAARAEVQAGPPLLAQLTLPSSITVPDQPDATAAYAKDLFESVGALGLDMTRFIFGDLQVRSVERLVNKAVNVSGFAGILTSPRNDVIQVAGNWGAASNFSLTLHRPGRRVELLPFEIATEYEGMEVSLPSDEYPIRRYLPKVKNRTMLEGIDLQEKPGFVVETRAFREIVNGRKPEVSVARLADAYAVTKLCEELTGITYQE